MTSDYITKKVFRKYLSISIAAMAAATIGMMVDGIVIGNFLGSASMAAFGIVSPLFILFSAVAGVFSNGSISLCGKYIGRDQPGKVNEVFTIAVICAGAAALICAATALFSRKPPPDSWERKEKSCLWPPLISGGWEREPYLSLFLRC